MKRAYRAVHRNTASEPQVSRAYEMLASQPLSLAGLNAGARDAIVITALADKNGQEWVVSRFSDSVWDLSSLFMRPNAKDSEKLIDWDALGVSDELVGDLKAALYVWWKRGRPGWKAASVTSMIGAVRQSMRLLQHLKHVGIERFDQVRPLHLSDYLGRLKAEGRLAPGSIQHRFRVVDLIWHFAGDLLHPMPLHPWAGQSFSCYCGVTGSDKKPVGKTPVIPPMIQATLFRHCDLVLSRAEGLLDQRDSGEIFEDDPHLAEIRDAVLYVLMISTGMRNSEAMGVKSGSWRVADRDKITYHWVKTTEHKTGKGEVEYLATPETLRALALGQRWAAPIQESIRREAERLRFVLRRHARGQLDRLPNGHTKISAMRRLRELEDMKGSIFVTRQNTGRPVMLNVASCRYRLGKLASAAGVKWRMSNHQCRRTFAWLIAQSRLGNRSLIFLKWQFKHSSMSMTELYASNPRQDADLYDEIFEEVTSSKADLIAGWFDEGTALSGGAGRKIVAIRAVPVRGRESLLRHTAAHVNIRATGLGWCLAEQPGCVAEGWYEHARCVHCGSGVIDPTYADTWRGLHEQNLELAKLSDCGPAVKQRAELEIARSAQVLGELGLFV